MVRREDWPVLLTGMAATLVGIGIARFGYTPLLPQVIENGWFSESAAVYLGAANLLGYLIGALSAHTLSERFSPRVVMLVSFIAIALSFALCYQPGPFSWFFIWRLISGIAGGVLMVVGPSTAMAHAPESRRKTLGAFVFTGIGIGAVLSSIVIPALLTYSLSVTWLTLAMLVSLIAWLGDYSYRSLKPITVASNTNLTTHSSSTLKFLVVIVMCAYALDAVGFIPHTVFWVDFLSRESSLGAYAASLQWTVFGLGAVCGPIVAGVLAQKLGWNRALSLAYMAKACAVFLPILSIGVMSRTLSSFVVGAMVPGIVALTSGRIAEMVGTAKHKRYWGRTTAAFAVAQAFFGYGMSALFDHWGSYQNLFWISSFALLIAAMLVFSSDKILTQQNNTDHQKETHP